jgi:hypothetical protein
LDAHGIPVNHTAAVSASLMEVALPVPLFKYHPKRYRQYNPIAKIIDRFSDAHESCVFTREGLETALKAVQHVGPWIGRTCVRDRVECPDPRASLVGLAYLALAHGELHRTGEFIYDLPAGLVERFRSTSIDEIPLAALKMPLPCCYVYFGPQEDLSWAPGWCVDGVYIIGTPAGEYQNFVITCAPPDVKQFVRAASSSEPQHCWGFGPEQLKLTAGLGIERAVTKYLTELREKLQIVVGKVPQVADPAADRAHRHAVEELEKLPARQIAWRETLNLVINTAAYLTAYPDDVEAAVPAGIPERLVRQLRSSDPCMRRRARTKLAAYGYSGVRLAGKRFRRDPTAYEPSPYTDKDVGVLFVPGHWEYHARTSPDGQALRWWLPYIGNEGAPTCGFLYFGSDELP